MYLAGEWVPAWLRMSITFLVAALGVAGLGWWVLRGDARNRAADKAVEGEAYADATAARIDWRPTEPYHLFCVDIESAGFISFGTDRRLMRWSAASGLEVLPHPDAGSSPG